VSSLRTPNAPCLSERVMSITAKEKLDQFLTEMKTEDSRPIMLRLQDAVNKLLWGSHVLRLRVHADEADHAEVQTQGQERLAFLGFTCHNVTWDRPVKMEGGRTNTAITDLLFKVDWEHTRIACVIR
jgi:hypothetical protein